MKNIGLGVTVRSVTLFLYVHVAHGEGGGGIECHERVEGGSLIPEKSKKNRQTSLQFAKTGV